YVFAGRIATVFLFIVSSGLVFFLDSALDAFNVILQIGAGTGLLYLLRWFWWRINAWAEVAAMVSSFAISIVLLILNKNGVEFSTHISLIITIAFTTISWVTASFVSPQTDKKVLIEFYKKVRPFGPGWKAIKIEAGIKDNELEESKNNIPLGLLGWVSGCIMIWSALFTVGNFLYGRLELAYMLLAVFAVSTFVLVKVVKKVWN
ncbi:MAG: Na+:solute symporter, partial [Ignavibacteria bacterium]|nr:Na+:solute symporter [Ignavibacteria bacterium]